MAFICTFKLPILQGIFKNSSSIKRKQKKPEKQEKGEEKSIKH